MSSWSIAIHRGAVLSDFEIRFQAEAVPLMPDVYRAAVRMTRDRTKAQDVTQEVFLQAWRSFAKFEKGTNCKAWLFKILFHCLDHERRKWWRVRLFQTGEEFIEEQMVAPVSIPEHLTDETILAAIDSLKPDHRAVVLLADVQELSYKETAEVLGLPLGTVMSRLSRARAALRESLEPVAKEYGIGEGQ